MFPRGVSPSYKVSQATTRLPLESSVTDWCASPSGAPAASILTSAAWGLPLASKRLPKIPVVW